MRRLIKKLGDYRISGEAAEEMRRAVGEYSLALAEAATESARGDNRRTILERDIRAALLKDRKAWET